MLNLITETQLGNIQVEEHNDDSQVTINIYYIVSASQHAETTTEELAVSTCGGGYQLTIVFGMLNQEHLKTCIRSRRRGWEYLLNWT